MRTEALLVMDVQTGVLERYSEHAESLLETLNKALDAARSTQTPVIYVRIAFRDGAPEVSPRNKSFSRFAGSGTMSDDSPAAQVHSAVAPQAGDVVVTKRRTSAFSGSDLDVVLRSLGVDSLVLTGVSTSGVVLSTLRQAADLDFTLTVLSDACTDSDPEVHDLLLGKLFPRLASVISTDEWIHQVRDEH